MQPAYFIEISLKKPKKNKNRAQSMKKKRKEKMSRTSTNLSVSRAVLENERLILDKFPISTLSFRIFGGEALLPSNIL